MSIHSKGFLTKVRFLFVAIHLFRGQMTFVTIVTIFCVKLPQKLEVPLTIIIHA